MEDGMSQLYSYESDAGESSMGVPSSQIPDGGRVLRLRDFFENFNQPPELSEEVCLPWVREGGFETDSFDAVQRDIEELVTGFGPGQSASVMDHALNLAGLTIDTLLTTESFPVFYRQWPQTLDMAMMYAMHRGLECAQHVEELCVAAKRLLRDFLHILVLVRDTHAHRDAPVQTGLEAEEGADGEDSAEKSSENQRFLAAVRQLASAEGTRKSPSGDVLAPEFYRHKFCCSYRTYGFGTDGRMMDYTRHLYNLMENPSHPRAYLGAGMLEKFRLAGLQGRVPFFENIAKWLESNQDHVITPVVESAELVSFLVGDEPAVFHPGRVPLSGDSNPEDIKWPSWRSVKDFSPQDFGLDAACVSRCFLKQPAEREWFDIVDKLKSGLHPDITGRHSHVESEFYRDGYHLMNVEWRSGSIASLKRRVDVKTVWKETVDSGGAALSFVQNGADALAFRKAEMDLMELLKNTIRTPCFDAIMHSQGYHLRAMMIAGMRLFGYSSVPTQFQDPASKLWTANDVSRMCTFVHGLPKTGKSCIAATVAEMYRRDQLYDASANAQSESWFYANPSAFITLMRELGSARVFAKTQSMTDWLSFCVGENVTLKRKNRDPTVMSNPTQPILFFGNGAPYGEFDQWTRRWVILGFNKPLPQGDQQAALDKHMQAHELVPLMVKFSILYRYFLNTYSANEMSDPYTWLPKIYGNFKSIYISESHKLACFLMDEDRWSVVADESQYTRVDVIREMYKLWLTETGQNRSQPPPPACSVDNLRTLCQANGLILRNLTEEEKTADGLDPGRAYHCVCRLVATR